MINPFGCDCGYTFDASGPFGRIPCPSCRATWIVTKRGIKAETRIKVQQDRRGVSDVERLFRVMRHADGTILCSGCAMRTDLLTGREGTLAGKRGVYCVLCLATRPVRVQNETERNVKGFTRVQPLTWNNPIQRIEAETGILEIARSLERGSDPLAYGVLLSGANWAGLRVRPLPDRLLQDGQINPAYVNALRTPERIEIKGLGSFLVGFPSPSGAKNSTHVKGYHPDGCTCVECKRVSFAVRKVTVYLPFPGWQGVRNGVTLASVRPVASGIGQASINVVSGILARPKRQPIRVTRCAHYERTLPRAHRPKPDPVMAQPCDTAISRAFRRALDRAFRQSFPG